MNAGVNKKHNIDAFFATLHLRFLDFRLLTDVIEWANNECSECMISHLNISNRFTFSHPLKEENHRKNYKCKA